MIFVNVFAAAGLFASCEITFGFKAVNLVNGNAIDVMKDQADLFDNAEFVAQPVEIPANVKPTSFDEWVRQNGKQLAVKFCKEHPNFDWLIDDMHELIRINTFREFKTFMVYLDSQYEEWLKIPVKEYHANSKK